MEGRGKETYVVLVREHEQLAWHLLRLQHIERSQTLGNGQAVVELAVDDLHHNTPLPVSYLDTTQG